MHEVASSYNDLGRYAEACIAGDETLKLQKAMLGPDDADTLRGMSSLAFSYLELDRKTDALKLLEEAWPCGRPSSVPTTPRRSGMSDLAYGLCQGGPG